MKHIWPFYYLSSETLARVQANTIERPFVKGDVLLPQGQRSSYAYFLLSGSVERIQKGHPDHFEELLQESTCFGLASLLLDIPSHFEFRAHSDGIVYQVSLQLFQECLQNEQRFAVRIATALRDHRSVFSALDEFCLLLQTSSASNTVTLDSFVEHYKNTNPALHPKMNGSEIDFHAWSYALNRLPINITTTHNILLTRNLPPLYQNFKEQPSVPTRYRRRAIWQLSEGKSLVILRDRQTDLADFISNLCVHFIESQKLRRRFARSSLLPQIKRAAIGEISGPDMVTLEKQLPLTPEIWKSFLHLWPSSSIQLGFERLYDILVHHEDYLLHLEKDYRDFSSDLVEEWGRQILALLERENLNGNEYNIHIISSNTYSVRHCLSPWVHGQKDVILAWGQRTHPEIYGFFFVNPIDRLYALLPYYLRAHPKAEQAMLDLESTSGFYNLSADLFLGIDVNVINCDRLSISATDPILESFPARTIIVNIDYAFGRQAEDVLGCLITLFGERIQSINVMGKAGGLCGQRGDIMLAHHTLMERSDGIYQINNTGLSAKAISADSGREVFEGTVLTVYGTLLQNHSLLHYYRRFWNCIGLEMEGSFYARKVHRSQHIQILPAHIPCRFLYYMSDLPLQEGAQLSVDMSPWELIPPVYSITRAFLHSISEQK